MPRNPSIVKANQQFEYTREQILEIKKCAQDPVYFIKKYVRIQHPKHGSIPFELYPYQEEMLKDFRSERFCIVLSARQTGKTWTTNAYLLWYAMFNEDKTILIVSNKNDNAMENIGRIQYMYENLPNWLKPGVNEDGWNKHEVGFDNKSRIISKATTESSGRGYSISLLFCDEFAFVRPGIQDAFWTSIQPTLATGGACIICSTPNGDANLFARLWRGAEAKVNGFKSRHVKWDEPPGRDENFKLLEQQRIGVDKWRQEYECEFLSSEALLFNSLMLMELTQKVSLPRPNERGIHFWKPFEKGKTYLIGLDPGTGAGQDFTVIEVFEFPSLQQVAEFRSNTTATPYVYSIAKWIFLAIRKQGGTCYFSVENNGVGEGIVALLQADETLPDNVELVSEMGKNKVGMQTLNRTKLKACINFKNLVESGKMEIRSKNLLTEMKSFVRDGSSYDHEEGSTSDCISACLIVVRMIEEIASYDQHAYDMLYTLSGDDTFGDLDSEYDDSDEGVPVLIGESPVMPDAQPLSPDSFDPWTMVKGNF